MKKIPVFFITIIIFIIVINIILPSAYAQCNLGETETELGCVPNNPIGATKQLYGVGLGLVGGVGLLFIIYGAYLVLSSQGDPTQLQKGKSYIIYSIIGIILAVAGFALYQIISVDVLKLPGFSK